jgi:uracil-DNA glycosylase
VTTRVCSNPRADRRVEELLDEVSRIRVPGALNLYDEGDSTAWGDQPGQATGRRHALRHYLVTQWAAPTVLVGEAPGKDGARWTGVPFSSMRLLTGSGPSEPTATIMHRVLSELACTHRVLLWNASMLFAPGNRDPSASEVEACAHVLELVCQGRAVFAIGRFAQSATGAPYIRHPSHGGASRFGAGVRMALHAPASVDVRRALERLDASPPERPARNARKARVRADDDRRPVPFTLQA